MLHGRIEPHYAYVRYFILSSTSPLDLHIVVVYSLVVDLELVGLDLGLQS